MTKNSLPPKWQGSQKSIRAVQVAFEFSKPVTKAIREDAMRQGLSASDLIRGVIGLQAKKAHRPRLTVSLSIRDYQHLAERYKLSEENREEIRAAIRDELVAYYKQIQGLVEKTQLSSAIRNIGRE